MARSQGPGNHSLCLRQGLAQVRKVADDSGDTGEREDAEHSSLSNLVPPSHLPSIRGISLYTFQVDPPLHPAA
jgi:hypothetical protein